MVTIFAWHWANGALLSLPLGLRIGMWATSLWKRTCYSACLVLAAVMDFKAIIPLS